MAIAYKGLLEIMGIIVDEEADGGTIGDLTNAEDLKLKGVMKNE